jgi:hypothetical protein
LLNIANYAHLRVTGTVGSQYPEVQRSYWSFLGRLPLLSRMKIYAERRGSPAGQNAQ